jgi:protease-4
MITVAGVFVGLMLFFVGLPFVLITMAAGAAKPAATPAHSVLKLDLRQSLTDQTAQSPFAAFSGGGLSVMGIVQTLRHAETDDKVKGLLVRLPDVGMAPAAADELRQAFRAFRAKGKPILSYSQGLYPSGVVTSTYMLGAASNSVWMQPGSSFEVTGLSLEDIFFKRLFDKYGVKAEYEQRYEYKNAVNPYLYSDYTAAHKQSTLSWMTSIYDRALNTAALDRKANGKSLHSLIEAGPYSAKEALDKGLIDKLGQVKEAEQYMLKQAGADSELVDFEDYQSGVLRSVRTPNALDGTNPAIAVITAEGPIITGHGGSDSAFSNEQIIYSDEISDAIYQAIEDKDVKAIVMRVSSPGGSDTASEQILAAVRAAKAAGKPVVVSMGTYAASGGYWISSQASAIVAQPTTLTGSIGVFGGKFALGDGLGRVGIDVRHTTVGGEFAGIYGMGDGFSAKQRAGFAKSIDAVYDGFIARVAEGRKLSPARVREIAKGRVWTGEQALQLGLVDQLGGFYDAVDKAKSLAGLSKSKIRLTFLPTQQSPFQAFERALGVSSTAMRTTAAAAWLLGDPRAQGVMDTMMQARLRDQAHATVLAPTPVN